MNFIEEFKLIKSINNKLKYITKEKTKRVDSLVYWLKDFNLKMFLKESSFFALIISSAIILNGSFVFSAIEPSNWFEGYGFLIFSLTFVGFIILNALGLYIIYRLNKYRRNKEYFKRIKGKKTKLFKIIYRLMNSNEIFSYIKYEKYKDDAIEKVIKELTEEEKELILRNPKSEYMRDIYHFNTENKFFNYLRDSNKHKEIKSIPKLQLEDFIKRNIRDTEKAYLLLEKTKIEEKPVINNKRVISL